MTKIQTTGTIIDMARIGDRVTIVTPHGGTVTGKVYWREAAHCVIGTGRHGQPYVATAENTIRVKKAS